MEFPLSQFVRQEHPDRRGFVTVVRHVLVARITSEGVDYIRARDLDPMFNVMKRLRAIAADYHSRRRQPPEHIRERLLLWNPKVCDPQRLYDESKVETQLVLEGYDRGDVQAVIEERQKTLAEARTEQLHPAATLAEVAEVLLFDLQDIDELRNELGILLERRDLQRQHRLHHGITDNELD
jgi:hypothetical protein